MATKKTGVIWVDGAGERVLHVISTGSGAASIEAELEAVSQAKVVEDWEGDDSTYTVVPGTGTYITVRQTAALYFVDGTGSQATLYVPAPDNAIFLSDGVTVDPATIPSLITAAVGNLLSGAGNPVTAFVGGQLIGTRLSGIRTI